jgi:hypothetical protein
VGVGVAQDQVEVFLVAQHQVVEGLQGELAEFHRPAAHLLDLLALSLRDGLGHAAGHGGAGMDLAAADDLHRGVAVLARLDHLAADLQADLADDAQDVALGHRGVRPHDEVRAAQDEEVGGVVGEEEGGVEQLAQLAPGGRRRQAVDRVGGLGGGHVMGLRADAADAVGQHRHFLHRAAHAEALEAAQFRHLQVGVGDVAGVVQEDLDLAVAFQAGQGIDADALHVGSFGAVGMVGYGPWPNPPYGFSARAARFARSSEWARLKR